MLKFTCFPAGERVADGVRRQANPRLLFLFGKPFPDEFYALADNAAAIGLHFFCQIIQFRDFGFGHSDANISIFRTIARKRTPDTLVIGRQSVHLAFDGILTYEASKVNRICNISETCRNIAVILARLIISRGARRGVGERWRLIGAATGSRQPAIPIAYSLLPIALIKERASRLFLFPVPCSLVNGERPHPSALRAATFP